MRIDCHDATRLMIIAAVSCLFAACSDVMLGSALAGAARGANAAVNPQSSSPKLMVFGGRGHDTYLGCFTCSEHASDSIFNEHGSHGSEYSSSSIHNQYSQFGSAYSQYSACNRYASDPPVIVDQDGNFYGRLTLNVYHRQAYQDDGTLVAWLKLVCNS